MHQPVRDVQESIDSSNREPDTKYVKGRLSQIKKQARPNQVSQRKQICRERYVCDCAIQARTRTWIKMDGAAVHQTQEQDQDRKPSEMPDRNRGDPSGPDLSFQ
jgi:hypothetical protein